MPNEHTGLLGHFLLTQVMHTWLYLPQVFLPFQVKKTLCNPVSISDFVTTVICYMQFAKTFGLMGLCTVLNADFSPGGNAVCVCGDKGSRGRGCLLHYVMLTCLYTLDVSNCASIFLASTLQLQSMKASATSRYKSPTSSGGSASSGLITSCRVKWAWLHAD